MSVPRPNPILSERVKPAMLNPLVLYVTATTDMKWVMLCVVITAVALLFALR